MKIYSLDKKSLVSIADYPFINLDSQHWDDYGRKTLFTMWVHESASKSVRLGKIKVISSNPEDYGGAGYINVPSGDPQLPDNFASLGQDLDFYRTVASYFSSEDAANLLERINDLATSVGLREQFERLDEYKGSLIRFSEAEQALHRGRNVLEGAEYEDAFEFTFSCKVGNAPGEHAASFNFKEHSGLPNRIIAVIGENGAGKTQYLSKMALALSGEESDGVFSGSRPLFSKIIAISYSAFDNFRRPKSKKTFSYKYCGLRDESGFLTPKKMDAIYASACDRIQKQNRVGEWYSALKLIMARDIVDAIYLDLFENEAFGRVSRNSDGHLSSGQSVLLYVITEIVASIQKDSLILFDEPEVHLHPRAISNMVTMFRFVLEKFGSYAIMATHSPVILQEIPSRYVNVFERVGSVPNVRSVELETFGENISNITKNVFSLAGVENDYRGVLKRLSEKHSLDEVQGLFDGRLSLNAMVFLKGCYEK
ncbi:AAA family ATPase [Pseudomonas maumuensis]|uniref:ATP-binding protein n=1 Tax=Pseudomonas maumuensis TaxID=2842354 RepID=A0ABX8NS42_9PSED|nr:AAA family ATPase [Pseudomonas maumuensis]QXH58887.1 ATP-binding protein [Pseudomonas maumuensis]